MNEDELTKAEMAFIDSLDDVDIEKVQVVAENILNNISDEELNENERIVLTYLVKDTVFNAISNILEAETGYKIRTEFLDFVCSEKYQADYIVDYEVD